MQSLTTAEKQGEAFAVAKGAASLAALRALPADKLLPAATDSTQFRFAPVVDGWSIPEDPLSAIAAGHTLDLPILTGMQADEGSSSRGYGHSSVDQLQEASNRMYGTNATRFQALYPFSDDAAASAQSKSAARDRGMASMYLWAALTTRHDRSPVYTYYWAHALPWPERPEFAAFHSSEVPYVLGNLKVMPRPFTAEDNNLSAEATSWWANFIRTGNPNGPGLPPWQPFDAAHPQTMEIDVNAHIRPLMTQERFAFWQSVLAPSLPGTQGSRAAN